MSLLNRILDLFKPKEKPFSIPENLWWSASVPIENAREWADMYFVLPDKYHRPDFVSLCWPIEWYHDCMTDPDKSEKWAEYMRVNKPVLLILHGITEAKY